jgi:hypothetical protein
MLLLEEHGLEELEELDKFLMELETRTIVNGMEEKVEEVLNKQWMMKRI